MSGNDFACRERRTWVGRRAGREVGTRDQASENVREGKGYNVISDSRLALESFGSNSDIRWRKISMYTHLVTTSFLTAW